MSVFCHFVSFLFFSGCLFSGFLFGCPFRVSFSGFVWGAVFALKASSVFSRASSLSLRKPIFWAPALVAMSGSARTSRQGAGGGRGHLPGPAEAHRHRPRSESAPVSVPGVWLVFVGSSQFLG